MFQERYLPVNSTGVFHQTLHRAQGGITSHSLLLSSSDRCCHRGAVQAGVLGFGLFIFSTKVAALVNVQELPEAYTVSGKKA